MTIKQDIQAVKENILLKLRSGMTNVDSLQSKIKEMEKDEEYEMCQGVLDAIEEYYKDISQ
jgi:hypothetical protein